MSGNDEVNAQMEDVMEDSSKQMTSSQQEVVFKFFLFFC